MKYDIWSKWYKEILDDFGFLQVDDESSASCLNEILNKEGFLSLEDLFFYGVKSKTESNKFIIFGAGPSLKSDILKIKKEYDLDDYILISADGATTALIEEHIIPDIVATDLDGKLDDLLLANYRGAFVVIHGHGNNKDLVEKYTPFFYNILGTTQSKPEGVLYNFGGFTDGDRAVFLALALGAKDITLAGMDFGNFVTKYSRPNIKEDLAKADEIKTKKLLYAEKLVNWIVENEDVDLVNLSKQ